MKKIICIAIFFAFGTVYSQDFIGNHVIIKIKDKDFNVFSVDNRLHHLNIDGLDGFLGSTGVSEIQQVGQSSKTHTFLLVYPQNVDVLDLCKRLKNFDAIEYAEPNYTAEGGGILSPNPIIPNDTRFNRQWGFLNNGTLTGVGTTVNDCDADIDLAWDIETGDPELIIAISDSGLRLSHPDIMSRLWSNPDETANGVDDDGNGLIDDINGYDFVNIDAVPTDDHGHGTNIAGIIGAVANNSSMYTGVNWNSKIMVIKVLNSANTATQLNMANSIYYAVDKGAKIISMSIGGTTASTTLTNAVAFANSSNVMLVACMMNTNNAVSYYPAAFSTTYANVVAVGSTNPNDRRTAPFFWDPASGSNYGPHINVVAPGNFIYGLDYASNTNANNYWGGTSQATPLVAGIASLIFSQNAALTPAEVKDILQNSAQDMVGLPSEDVAWFDHYMGHGRVNAFNALQLLSAGQVILPIKDFKVINPVSEDKLEVICSAAYDGTYALSIYDMNGRLLSEKTVVISAGMNKVAFDFETGHYLVRIKNDDYSKIFKIIKE